MHPNPVFLRLGPITVYWYGVLIVAGAMLAAYIVSKLSSRNGHDPEIAWNLLIVALFSGIIGARIYHIISSWDYYSAHPSEMFGLQMSGFGIFGAVAGGMLGLYIFTRVKHLRFLEWADYVAPGLLLAQAIGRWGNFFNQELYGPPADLPWAIAIDPAHRLPGYEMFERFHPTFLYESILNLIGALLLLYLARRWKSGRLYGDIFFIYGMTLFRDPVLHRRAISGPTPGRSAAFQPRRSSQPCCSCSLGRCSSSGTGWNVPRWCITRAPPG